MTDHEITTDTTTNAITPRPERIVKIAPSVDQGQTFYLGLDRLSATSLARSYHLILKELNVEVSRQFLTRRALRLYLEHLRQCGSKEDELKELIKCVEGIE